MFLYPLSNPPYTPVLVEYNIEQADAEYSFNYAIDSFWRIFATVMGMCFPTWNSMKPTLRQNFTRTLLRISSTHWAKSGDRTGTIRYFAVFWENFI